MSDGIADPRHTALVLADLQNDFIHPDGAYGRAGQGSDAIAALPARLKPLREALRAHGFDDEDIWDIGAITAFFGLSNRLANLSAMRPNDEFYLLGRVPRVKA